MKRVSEEKIKQVIEERMKHHKDYLDSIFLMLKDDEVIINAVDMTNSIEECRYNIENEVYLKLLQNVDSILQEKINRLVAELDVYGMCYKCYKKYRLKGDKLIEASDIIDELLKNKILWDYELDNFTWRCCEPKM